MKYLVNGGNNSPALVGHFFKDLDDILGHVGVESGCWLITEHQRRVGQNFTKRRVAQSEYEIIFSELDQVKK